MNNNRLIFTDDFYRLGAILLSEKFAVLKKLVLKRYSLLGYPVPLKGFPSYGEYRLWIKHVIKSVGKEDSPGAVIENILSQFNVDPKNETYRTGIAANIFQNKQFGKNFCPLQEQITLLSKSNSKQQDLLVRIHPWTKKSDYINLWETIRKVQKRMPNYRGKEKYQITFPRDYCMYQLYLKVKYKKIEVDPNKSILDNMTSTKEYETLSKKYKEGCPDDFIRDISSRFNKLLGSTNIL